MRRSVFCIAERVMANHNTFGTVWVGRARRSARVVVAIPRRRARRATRPTTSFTGQIDDVRIYNRALSTNEVALLYALESQSTLQPPITLTANLGTGPNFNLNLIGIPGQNYILQTATNLLPPRGRSFFTTANACNPWALAINTSGGCCANRPLSLFSLPSARTLNQRRRLAAGQNHATWPKDTLRTLAGRQSFHYNA